MASRADVKSADPNQFCIGESAAWRRLMETAREIALSTAPVLIQGETGSGKEVVARAVHAASLRHNHPFLVVDCGALKGDLLEKELFGCPAGGFTGTPAMASGLLEAAEGGTLFLDAISELNGAMQARVLRALEHREYRHMGDTRTRQANVRFIGATNRDLQELVLAGRFQDDLLYRLCTIGLQVPPLRERIDDIPLLAQHFLRSLQPAGRPTRLFSLPALKALVRYSWPGNVRELRHVVERVILLSPPKNADLIGPEEVRSLLSLDD